jgi:hypothetical protein
MNLDSRNEQKGFKPRA